MNEQTKPLILVVDDIEVNIDVLIGILSDQYEVAVAMDGEGAIEIAIENKPDLILMDVMMPGMDGYAACDYLKQREETRNIPVIFVTAKNEALDEERGFSLGAVDYIHKPVHPQLLRARVSTHLELKRHRDQLEMLVSARTSALEEANRQLNSTKLELESANQAKSDFLSVISHEMRTPLNSIIGFSELLLCDSPLAPKERGYIQIIHRNGARLLGNIVDILDFVELSPHAFSLQSVPFNLFYHINDVISLLSGEAEQKGLIVQVEIDPSVPSRVIGDAHRLGQVLSHLLHNGIKFTNQGHVLVRVSATHSSVADRITIHFTVEDTGIGIPPEKLQFIFHQFTQIEAPTTRKRGGFGLGLAICHKLVTLMSGKLQVVRSSDRGTTISFAVDLMVSVETEEALPESLTMEAVLPESDAHVRTISVATLIDQGRVGPHLVTMEHWLSKGSTRANESLKPLWQLLAGTHLEAELSKLDAALQECSFTVARRHLATLVTLLEQMKLHSGD